MIKELQLAMSSMRDALARLDEVEAPGDVGAHLDLAVARLQAFLDQSGNEVTDTASK